MTENVLTNLETELRRHLRHLCVEIGPRPIGSRGDQAAADYIQNVFRAAGLEVEEQRFECPAWEDQETCLEVEGERVEAAANAFSPPCDVSAPGVAVGTVAELKAADLGGRIGILYGDLTKSPLSPKSWFLKSERDAHIVQLLEEKRPEALITVQSRAGDLERVIADWEFLIPSAAVPARVGLGLLQRSGSTLRLRIKSQRAPGHTCNVVARKAGGHPGRIVLCAHYDTTIDTPGAVDNAAGVAVLLALAQRLSQAELALGLEWIAFSGHEYLPLGDDEYLRRRGHFSDTRGDFGSLQDFPQRGPAGRSLVPRNFEQIVAAINFDAVGEYLGANSITMMTSSQAFQNQVVELTGAYPGVAWVDPWPQSNHSTFAWRGVPSIAFSSVGGVNFHHLRADSIEWASPAKLGEVVWLVTEIVKSLQDKSFDWTRESEPAPPS